MFDFIQNNKRVAQIILAFVTLPFAFFGINSYFDSTAEGYVAKVGDQSITPQQFASALSQRQEQLRRSLGTKVDPVLLEGSGLRTAVLDSLIRDRLLLERARRDRIVISDRDIEQLIAAEPTFQENGKFSETLYMNWLTDQGETEANFETEVRTGLKHDRVDEAYAVTAIIPTTVAQRLLQLNNEQRDVSIHPLAPEQFVDEIKLDPAAAKQYYDAHTANFQVPDRVRVNYIVFSLGSMASQVPVTDDEVRQFYENNHARYAQDEQRRASHILIAVDPKANAAVRETARAKAERLLEQVRRHPSQFAEVAKENSQDPGSAVQGGDLGWFSRGAMVKPFDEAVFKLKPGEISDLVQTQYGYHIIRLDAIKGRGFDEVKASAADDLRRQKAMQQFSALAERLNDLAYEQSDSLQPAADALKLPIQQSGWISRSDTGGEGLLGNAKLLDAVFSNDVLKNKRNTDAIDVGNNTLVVAHVADYQAASTRPFSEVSDNIEKYLARQQAAQLAIKEGRDWLAKLKRGESLPVQWSPPQPVKRDATRPMLDVLTREIYKTDIEKLPAYGGVETPKGGYLLFKISSVSENGANDATALDAARAQLQQTLSQEEMDAYIAALKAATNVKINQQQLESSPQ